jgi:hypothetical protein
MLDRDPKNHLIIAGTGRAGTSFLVRYLDAVGLQTEIARSGDGQWFEHANAGFETLPIDSVKNDLPYVVKSPWLYEYCEQLLADRSIRLDAVIVPVRSLREAASSRIIVELRDRYEKIEAMTAFDEPWETHAGAPGGVLFSLNLVDQERLLAVGFHRVVEQFVKADIPIIFLDFPRIVEDADYLFGKLRGFLPENVDIEFARKLHGQIAERGKVRVDRELVESTSSVRADSSVPVELVESTPIRPLDRIALRREVDRLRKELAAARESHRSLSERCCALEVELVAARELHRVVSERCSARELDLAEARREAARVGVLNDALLCSTSWKMTRPLRALIDFTRKVASV